MPTDTHEWLCQQIMDNARDAFVLTDRDGIIRLWNAGAEAMFGYWADEALGHTLDLIIPEHLRERHWAGYHKAMTTGATRYDRELLAVPARRKDGTRLSLEFSNVTRTFVLKSLGLMYSALQREDPCGFPHEDGLPEGHPQWVRNTTGRFSCPSTAP
jgi:PAS domain S-box-containing protein